MNINRLRIVFKEKNVKNRVIAEYFGKDEGTISKWRNNKRQPSIQELYEIAKLLRINIHDLIEPTYWKDETSETYEDFGMKLKKDDL